MSLSESLVKQIRANVLRAIKNTPGTQASVNIRVLLESTTNVYGDESEETYRAAFDHALYIEFNPPLKVVKDLGWWKAGESLPILCYIPYLETWSPKMGDLIDVPEKEGYMSGTYKILQVKAFGQGKPLVWVVNLEPERSP